MNVQAAIALSPEQAAALVELDRLFSTEKSRLEQLQRGLLQQIQVRLAEASLLVAAETPAVM